MQLTRHTDYALRTLIHLAAVPTGRATVGEIAQTYGLSRNHLMKVVHNLGRGGFITTARGRGGGFTLARPAQEIRLGDVIRYNEPGLKSPAHCDGCALIGPCGLTGILAAGLRAFLDVMDSHSVADAASERSALAKIIAELAERR